MQPLYTLLLQDPKTPLKEWYAEIFGSLIGKIVEDGAYKIVLDNCIVSDTIVRNEHQAYYSQFRGKNAFLLLSPDEWYATPHKIYKNFCGVFRSHYSGVFDCNRVKHLPVGYNPGFSAVANLKKASERNLLWSFLGEVNKSTRPECLRSLLAVKPNYWLATDGWTPTKLVLRPPPPRVSKTESDYRAIMCDSVFSPCPMGNVSQESLRVYEAIQSGSIPILEQRLFMDVHRYLLGNHPFPTFTSWTAAADYIAKMARDPSRLDDLQKQCVDWWAEYKKTLTSEVNEFMVRLHGQYPTTSTCYMKTRCSMPGWAMFELSRHHTFRALCRRARRQIKRVLSTGNLIEHY